MPPWTERIPCSTEGKPCTSELLKKLWRTYGKNRREDTVLLRVFGLQYLPVRKSQQGMCSRSLFVLAKAKQVYGNIGANKQVFLDVPDNGTMQLEERMVYPDRNRKIAGEIGVAEEESRESITFLEDGIRSFPVTLLTNLTSQSCPVASNKTTSTFPDALMIQETKMKLQRSWKSFGREQSKSRRMQQLTRNRMTASRRSESLKRRSKLCTRRKVNVSTRSVCNVCTYKLSASTARRQRHGDS